MIETVEDAEELVNNEYFYDWPPMTSDPKVNFLIDQALGIGPEDWEEVKEDYEDEVEIASDSEEINVIDPEEL